MSILIRTTIAAACTMTIATTAQADQVIADDLIVQGNLCVGAVCADGWTFGGAEVQFHAEDPTLYFGDTSTDPATDRDWQIITNDASFEFFLIYDNEASTFPFIIDGGAPSRALQIRADGNIATGSNGSSAAFHITRGDSPRIRFEQDGSAANTPHTWDLIANEVQFRVADQTNGTGPFYIYPGPDNEGSLTIDGYGKVGMGTYSPQAQLHITDDDGQTGILVHETSGATVPRNMLTLLNNGRPEIVMGNTGTGGEWSFGAGTNFILKQGAVGSLSSAKTTAFQIDPSGNAILAGSLTTGGTTCGGGCDAVFRADYDLPSIAEHAEAMFALGHLPNVGPTAEGEPFNLTDKFGRVLNELEHAHIYIAELEERDRAQQAEITALRSDHAARIAALEARLAAPPPAAD